MRSCIVDVVRSDCLPDEEDDGGDGMRKGVETTVDWIEARIACFLPYTLSKSAESERGVGQYVRARTHQYQT